VRELTLNARGYPLSERSCGGKPVLRLYSECRREAERDLALKCVAGKASLSEELYGSLHASVPYNPNLCKGSLPTRARRDCAGSSRHRHYFIADEVKPNRFRQFLRLIKVKRAHDFLNILTQLLPRVSLGHDRIGQALGAKAAVCFLKHFKNKLVHAEKGYVERVLRSRFRRITRGVL
jgi:hypothetical protein